MGLLRFYRDNCFAGGGEQRARGRGLDDTYLLLDNHGFSVYKSYSFRRNAIHLY